MAKKYVNPLSDYWWSNPLNFRQHPLVSKSVTVMNIRCAGFCYFPTVQKSCQELLQKKNRKQCLKIHYFNRLSNVPNFYANHLYCKRGLTIELHFSVAGYGGLHLPFSGTTQYLRSLVSVYERPIIAGVWIWIVSSTYTASSTAHTMQTINGACTSWAYVRTQGVP